MPKTIKIMGERVTVSLAGDAQFAKYSDSPQEILGLAVLLEKKILLRRGLSPDTLKKVLAHEIFHFILYESGVSQGISGEIEEVLCQAFSRAYFEMRAQRI
jgi:hypothetical protein